MCTIHRELKLPIRRRRQGESGQLCGGFSDVAWVQSGNKGRYIHSDEAFLFTLVNSQSVPPTRFPVKKRMYAICYHPQ